MEILWWLAPAAVATTVAMAWAGWMGREGRGEVDRDVAVERLARALTKKQAAPQRVPREVRATDRSTGIAVRPTRPTSGTDAVTRRVS